MPWFAGALRQAAGFGAHAPSAAFKEAAQLQRSTRNVCDRDGTIQNPPAKSPADSPIGQRRTGQLALRLNPNFDQITKIAAMVLQQGCEALFADVKRGWTLLRIVATDRAFQRHGEPLPNGTTS